MLTCKIVHVYTCTHTHTCITLCNYTHNSLARVEADIATNERSCYTHTAAIAPEGRPAAHNLSHSSNEAAKVAKGEQLLTWVIRGTTTHPTTEPNTQMTE